MHISSAKIASLDPIWARFHGLSVLFDNPSPTLLYEQLSEVVNAMEVRAGPGVLRDGFGWCPLPPASFHVTVCDGPNDANIGTLESAARTQLGAVLDELPDLPSRWPGMLACLVPTALQTLLSRTPLIMRAAEVFISGHVAALRLEPVQIEGWLPVERARDDYAAQLRHRLGLRIPAWRPHVSLGYFANLDAARCASEAVLGEWNELLANRIGATVAFGSAELFGFTDMTRFVRRRPLPHQVDRSPAPNGRRDPAGDQ